MPNGWLLRIDAYEKHVEAFRLETSAPPPSGAPQNGDRLYVIKGGGKGLSGGWTVAETCTSLNLPYSTAHEELTTIEARLSPDQAVSLFIDLDHLEPLTSLEEWQADGLFEILRDSPQNSARKAAKSAAPKRKSARAEEGGDIAASPAKRSTPKSKGKQPMAPLLGKALIGRRVKVRWQGGEYYSGTVRNYAEFAGEHLVVYDDQSRDPCQAHHHLEAGPEAAAGRDVEEWEFLPDLNVPAPADAGTSVKRSKRRRQEDAGPTAATHRRRSGPTVLATSKGSTGSRSRRTTTSCNASWSRRFAVSARVCAGGS